MVFLLIFNVVDQPFFCFNGFCKSSVAILPAFKVGEKTFSINKFIRGQFDVLDQSRNRNRRMYMGQNMKVIFYPIDAIEVAVFVGKEIVDVGK